MAELQELYKRSFDFKGKTGITDCWRALLFNTLFCYLGMLLCGLIKAAPLGFALLALSMLPLPALGVRRLRSAGVPPLRLLLSLVPIAGLLIGAYLLSLPDKTE